MKGAGRSPGRRGRRQAEAQLRQGGGAVARLRRRPRRHPRHHGRRPPGRSGRDRRPHGAALRGVRPRVGLEAAPAGPPEQDDAVQALQLDGAQGLRRPAARLQLRSQVLQARRRRDHLHLRRAAPLHPRGGVAGRLPGHRGQGEPPAPHRRTLQVRLAALHARLPRSAHRHVPRPLPAPAAAPVRRVRDAAHPPRGARRAVPHHRQAGVRQPHRAAPAAPPGGAAHHRRRPAAQPRADRRAHRQLARPPRARPRADRRAAPAGAGARGARVRPGGRSGRRGRREGAALQP